LIILIFFLKGYANYGKSDVQRIVSVVDDMFLLNYYDAVSQTFTAVLHIMNPNIEEDSDKVLFSQIVGGY
jgi:hypothetical protein